MANTSFFYDRSIRIGDQYAKLCIRKTFFQLAKELSVALTLTGVGSASDKSAASLIADIYIEAGKSSFLRRRDELSMLKRIDKRERDDILKRTI
jgi:hypothetical protein